MDPAPLEKPGEEMLWAAWCARGQSRTWAVSEALSGVATAAGLPKEEP